MVGKSRTGAHIWLRAETDRFETRTPLLPADAALLVEEGFKVTVEDSPRRIAKTDEYAAVGCEIVEEGSWANAPKETVILSVSGAVAEGTPVSYTDIVDKSGTRLIPTAYWGGFVGTALALWTWARQQRGLESLSGLKPFDGNLELLQAVEADLSRVRYRPQLLILGAMGSSGAGAVDFTRAVNLKAETWGRKETKAGGPFAELLQKDIVVNCVGMREAVKPFINRSMLDEGIRRLTVISDVTCDMGTPFNVFPWHDRTTSFAAPVRRYLSDPALDILALDRLPALLPRESSEQLSTALKPLLGELPKGNKAWNRATLGKTPGQRLRRRIPTTK